jgi:uncharacterized protein
VSDDSIPEPQPTGQRASIHRIVALLEVLICSDYPTQLALGTTFAALGYRPFTAHGELNLAFVVAVSLADTVLLAALIFAFLYAHGERPRDVFIGNRPVANEIALGVPLMLAALAIASAVLLTVQHVAPWLHSVEHNPLQGLLRRPRDAWLFALVVIVAGGVREEIQRAFQLHRFDVWLGGGGIGVVITSVAFGVGHLLQGRDAALATGLLGAFWGVVYLRRRSAAATIVSHAGFNLLQVVQFLAPGKI